jgi:DNA polymerase-3 subunit delta
MSDSETPAAAYLVHGEDVGLVSQALTSLLAQLVASDSQGGPTPVEEYGEPGRGEPRQSDVPAVSLALGACRTPPFLASRRIVVLRDAAGLDSSQVKDVVAYLAEPLSTTVLVLACAGKQAPAALLKAVRSAGVVVDAVPAPMGKARSTWFAERLRAGPVRLAPAAARRLEEHLGEDIARLDGVLASLAAAYGPASTVGLEDLEPFLGSAGGVAPWDLTDALDSGDARAAVAALQRMLAGGERHPLQVLATLHRHVEAMLRLDGSDATDEASAAALTGLRPYPAKKALAQSRRLGHERVAQAVLLVAAADLDLRGGLGWPDGLVLEVLVARLARLARSSAPAGRSARR